MNSTEFRKILDSKTISTEQFMRVHCCAEAMFRHLLLIGLRLQKVQYKVAAEISETYYTHRRRAHLKTIIKYCGLSYNDLLAFGNLNELLDLYWDYTSRYRNRLAHGLDIDYPNHKKLLKQLIAIDKRLIDEFEVFFTSKGKPSLLDEPKKWGAVKGDKADVEKICKKLLGKGLPQKPGYDPRTVAAIIGKLFERILPSPDFDQKIRLTSGIHLAQGL